MNRFLALIVLTATAGLLFSAAQARELYIWTDENGVKHYSNIAPSEATQKFQKEEEIPSGGRSESLPPQEGGQPPDRPFRPAADPSEPAPESGAPEQASSSEDEAGPAGAAVVPKLDLKTFPKSQGELVQREKTIVKALKSKLEDSAIDRQVLIESERRRLRKVIEDLEGAPLSKFGSQQNKQRQVGYYRYRLEEIETDPESYFEYGDIPYD